MSGWYTKINDLSLSENELVELLKEDEKALELLKKAEDLKKQKLSIGIDVSDK